MFLFSLGGVLTRAFISLPLMITNTRISIEQVITSGATVSSLLEWLLCMCVGE